MEHTLFDPKKILPLHWEIFMHTDLGELYRAIPFDELAKQFPKLKNVRGRKPWFSVQGGIGLMILKSSLGLSDAKLLNRLNTDWAMQYFCGIRLDKGQMIKDKDIISRWRRHLGKYLHIDDFQTSLANYWHPYIKQRHMVLMDATCYESHVRYPTDIKLLWESTQWVHKKIKMFCGQLVIRRPRYKYKSVKQRVTNFQKSRKKTYRHRRAIHKSLCYLLHKISGFFDALIKEYELGLSKKDQDRWQTIQKVYEQQKWRFRNKENFDNIPDRVVSLSKPFLRPIVRGKETKRVEFGAKAHTFQIDGINFVDTLSFSAFNESTRLQQSVWKAQKLMKTKMHQLGADQIYATNKNRSYCNQEQIATCFVRKGRVSKLEDQHQKLRQTIAKGRATVMEGAFGNEKNHFGLNNIKARTEQTEVLWIFFGIMTANISKISKRMLSTKHKKRKRA